MKDTKLQPSYRGSWALVVGINAYRFMHPLALACSDAESVAEILSADLGFPKEKIVTLLDAQATRAEIMKRFLAFDLLSPDDRLFFYFAGHGETVSLRGRMERLPRSLMRPIGWRW